MPNPILNIEHYHYSVANTTLTVPRLCIAPGRILGLVGPSGSGKSLTTECIMQINQRDKQSAGIFFDGQDLTKLSETQLRPLRCKTLRLVQSNSEHCFNPLLPVLQQLKSAGHASIACKRLVENRISALLQRMQLDQCVTPYTYPHQLSGGERQRLMILMAILPIPKLLILDEPSTALNASLKTVLIEYLKELTHNHNTAVLLISHDAHLLNALCDQVAIIKHGGITNPISMTHYRKTVDCNYHALKQCFNPSSFNSQSNTNSDSSLSPLLTLRRIHIQHPNAQHNTELITQLSANLCSKDTLGITGPSGCGKTTLAHALAQLIPYDGEMLLEHTPLHTLTSKELRAQRRHFQIVLQDPRAAFSKHLTMHEHLMHIIDAHLFNTSTSCKTAAILKLLESLGLHPNLLSHTSCQLSSGQLQRFAIARCLLLKPKLLILDESTTHLDHSTTQMLIKTLQQEKRSYGLNCIFISHDIDLIKALCTHVLQLTPHAKYYLQPIAHSFVQHTKETVA